MSSASVPLISETLVISLFNRSKDPAMFTEELNTVGSCTESCEFTSTKFPGLPILIVLSDATLSILISPEFVPLRALKN